MKNILFLEKKEIVINSGGRGLKLSQHVVEEIKKRGDEWAKDFIDNKFEYKYYCNYKSRVIGYFIQNVKTEKTKF